MDAFNRAVKWLREQRERKENGKKVSDMYDTVRLLHDQYYHGIQAQRDLEFVMELIEENKD